MSQSEPHPQPRSGVHAWDERDACSIASHTPTYNSVLSHEGDKTTLLTTPARSNAGPAARVAAAVMTRLRSRARLRTAPG